MPEVVYTENRSGPRYVATFPIRAEWDTPDGAHIVSEGETENVGPEGTLVHFQRELPPVGSTVSLLVLGDEGENCVSSLRCCASNAILPIRKPRCSCWAKPMNGAASSGTKR